MSNDVKMRIDQFNERMRHAQIFLFAARASELQRIEIDNFRQILAELAEWKKQAIEGGNEDHANLYLGMECYANAIRTELQMWVLLKEDKPDDAWPHLVDAQLLTTDAIRAHQAFAHIERHAHRLEVLEQLLFPPQSFLSAGLIVHKQTCTICGQEYEDCPHLVGMPYWGEFCRRRLEKVMPDHVALVDHPANKHCRITHFNVEGGKRNKMTWRIEPFDGKEQHADDKGGLTTSAILATASDFSASR
jgi:hypothetical protein